MISHDLTALLEPNPDTVVQDDCPLGFRGDFIDIKPHQGHLWVMVGNTYFARVVDPQTMHQFWQAYNPQLLS